MTDPRSSNSGNRSNRKASGANPKKRVDRTSKRQEGKRQMRRMLTEQLEARQLLATAPQLIGIQPNNSELIINGSVLESSPRELTFRFDESQVIHTSTLSGIRITRSGGDGTFGLSSISSDFGSGGRVDIGLTAVTAGSSPVVNVQRANLGTGASPTFLSTAGTLSITLNSNATTPTTAQQLVDAINASTIARQLVTATISGGRANTQIGQNNTTYSPIRLQNNNDIRLSPGQILVGNAPKQNEVTYRFADRLPHDKYRIEVFGFDDPVKGIQGLRNARPNGSPGDLFAPSLANTRQDTYDFHLDLGPQVVSVVPQPVVRNESGQLQQQRDTIVVYFDDNKLLAESAENPNFYQLIFTADTVRNTDDLYFSPTSVRYNASSNTATLRFSRDIDTLPGVAAATNTFRLRIGTRESAPLVPTFSQAAATAISDFNTAGAATFRFVSKILGESAIVPQINVVNTLTLAPGVPPTISVVGTAISIDLGRNNVTANELLQALQNNAAVGSLVSVQLEPGSNPSTVLNAPINYSPIRVVGLGSSFDTATNLGVIGSVNVPQTSLVLSSAINPVDFDFDLPGANDDPGHRASNLVQHISQLYGADKLDGITTIMYNFQRNYGADASNNPLSNVITDNEKYKQRIREAFQIWSNSIGVQFIETANQGITVAVGNLEALGTGPTVTTTELGMGVRRDPNFQNALMVLRSGQQWADNFGEDFFRVGLTGIAFLLGLERAGDLTNNQLMALNADGADSVFPGVVDVLHGRHLFRPDGNDIDFYRFEVAFDQPNQFGLFVAENFSERLPHSSSLDSLLHLYQQVQASATSNMAAGGDLLLSFDAVQPGLLGNNLQIVVTQSSRATGDNVLVSASDNLISVDLNSREGRVTTAQQFMDAINAHPQASRLVKVKLASGSAATLIGDRQITYSPIELQGGEIKLISRNDDYFSQDSLIRAKLGSGIYYVGVSASGNDQYDGVIQDTGLGGRSQGRYDLRMTFRAEVDSDSSLQNVAGQFPGDLSVTLDGDGDGTPGGVHNFWFQTRPLNRILSFNAGASVNLEGQVVTLTGANGTVRRFEFDRDGSVGIGNIPVGYLLSNSSGQLAQSLASTIVLRTELGINALADGPKLILTGERLVQLSTGFELIDIQGRTIFVDKSASPNADGSEARPFNSIAGVGVPNAFAVAQPGDIVRIVGNGGSDGNLSTVGDNFAYEVGFDLITGAPLSDGGHIEVPQGVTTMIDAGAVFKMFRSYVGIGSTNLGIDRSGAALQVLGTPILTSADGNVLRSANGASIPGSVYFTSWRDETIGRDSFAPTTQPASGDWGGISYRNDVDASAGRRNLEDEGIFLNYVNHADMRYGGSGGVFIDSIQQVVNPIQMIDLRPTATFNRISHSSDAAISATPNSFEETNFHETRFQANGAFTSDYDRVGPEIHHNILVNNSLNGLFIRVETPVGDSLRKLTTSARFNDVDIVHVISEDVLVQGTPGGALLDGTTPQADFVALQGEVGGKLLAGTYNYKITFVDYDGYESLASDPTNSITLSPVGTATAIRLVGLPVATGDFVARKVYRSSGIGSGPYELVAQLDATSPDYLDLGTSAGGFLVRDRADVRNVGLSSDPGGQLNGQYRYRVVMVDIVGRESVASNPTAVINATGGRIVRMNNLPPIQSGFDRMRIYRSGPQAIGTYSLIGELRATDGNSFVDNGSVTGAALSVEATNVLRPRLNASLVVDPGTVIKLEGARIELEHGANLIAEGLDGQPIVFTSKLDDRYGVGGAFDTNNDQITTTPAPGDWGGIYAAIGSKVSLDHATVAFAGGITRIEGTFRGFNPLEIQQATARVTNSTFEFNQNGQGGQGPAGRLGRLNNLPATIYVRGTQPILIGNTFLNNRGSAINIDVNSMNAQLLPDWGRATGQVDRHSEFSSNRGPLIRENRMDNNQINGLEVRPGQLEVQSIWDDTDIVHVLFGTVSVTNLHHEGGLRLQSTPDESLVIKVLGYGANFDDYAGAGFTATGSNTNAHDRVGGTLHVLGQPGFPVVITSFHDDTVGAGLKPDGKPQTDTNNNGIASIPRAADWRGVLLDEFANDRNVAIVLENEHPDAVAPGKNATTFTAQVLGQLAGSPKNSDEIFSLGFEVQGVLSEPTDVDVYSFTAEAGTEVWLDVDYTNQALDTILELLNANGQLLARSNRSTDETVDPSLLYRAPGVNPASINPLSDSRYVNRTHASGLIKDPGTINRGDSGMRVVLPGATGARSTFYFRIRSASTNPDNFRAGKTSGAYAVQVRMRAEQEFPGSAVQFADIRYATNGIHLKGLPTTSPLLGEIREDESSVAPEGNAIPAFTNDPNQASLTVWSQKPQYAGNLIGSKRAAISIGGKLTTESDLDFFHFDVTHERLANGQTGQAVPVVFDMDYADGVSGVDTSLSIYRTTTSETSGITSYELIYFGENSNLVDDRGNVQDLTRGSVGGKDPFIGAVALPPGTYAVGISSAARRPLALNNALRRPVASILSQTTVGPVGTGIEAVSQEFDFAGFSALDLPKLYFSNSSVVSVSLRDQNNTDVVLASNVAPGVQSMVNLADNIPAILANLQNLQEVRLVFRSTNAGAVANLVVGTAERGEEIIGALPGTVFVNAPVPPNTITTGTYQLEIRVASQAHSGNSNLRQLDAITLVAPAGNQLVSGDQFVLRDAGTSLTFEFTTSGNVLLGNIPVLFSASDSANLVAQRIRDAINGPGVQSRLKVSAASRDGSTTGVTGDPQVTLLGRAGGSFGKVGVVVHSGRGDQNVARDQGQMIIRDNFIRHARDYGVWTEPGERFQDPRHLLTNPLFGLSQFNTSDTIRRFLRNAISDIPPLGGTAGGAVRNLLEPNNSLLGGFNPGVVIANNVLESGGLGGVHVAGENPIFMITPRLIPPQGESVNTGDASLGSSTDPIDHFGTYIDDRDLLYIDSGRTKVKFEFDDLAGASTEDPTWGSGVEGGNGWDDDAVPIYYREDGGAQYLRPSTDLGNSPGYSNLEVLQSIRDSIFGSILVTNGTTQRVRATVAPSLLGVLEFAPPPFLNTPFYLNYFNRPALYVEGITNINWVDRNGFIFNPFDIRRVDVADDAQPFVRVLNNTIFGNDGRASFAADASAAEPNDTIAQAVQTWQGTAHNPIAYQSTAAITPFDVDIYQFKAKVGDRTVVRLNTSDSGLDPAIRIFDDKGRPQTFQTSTETSTTLGGSLVDFTATESGVYFAAISSRGNTTYDPVSLVGREAGLTTGSYAIDLIVLHPQNFTITVQNSSAYTPGSTFTIHQVADFGNGTNSRTFEFTDTGLVAEGNIPIRFNAEYRAPDMARAIAAAISSGDAGNPPLPNLQSMPNGRFSNASPLLPVSAIALGGMSGVEGGLTLFPLREDSGFANIAHSSQGIGHDRTMSGELSPTSKGDGTTERFVVVKNAAFINSQGSIIVDPDMNAGSNLDQLLPETGIMVSAGASPTLLNNVFVNVQTPIVNEETRVADASRTLGNRGTAPFGSGSANARLKPNEVIVGGSMYQFVEPATARNRFSFGIESSPTNVPNTTLDFNITLPNTHRTFVNAQGSNFLPAVGSRLIDSSIDSLQERQAFRSVKQAMGIAVSPIIAPSRDAFGQLRVDDPTVAPPNGLGANVFKDRGALERADFLGPRAEAVRPLDNDADKIDGDPTESVIELSGGVYPEFRVQLNDGNGTGIDVSTVVGPSDDLRLPGAAFTLFENGKLLREGFDYRFTFDSTKNELIFTPLAGVWKNDRVYEIKINNRNRLVMFALTGQQVSDGDSFTITDTNGGIVRFEYESGYRMQVPLGLALQVPLAGGASGGIADGDRFSLTINGTVTTFEFDSNANSLSGNRPIPFLVGASQVQIRDLLLSSLQNSGLPIFVRVVGDNQVFIGSESGVLLNTTFSLLQQPAPTQALKMPALGPRLGGVTDGQFFQVSDGRQTIIFEYDSNGTVTAGRTAINLNGTTTVRQLAQATLQALQSSPLNIQPQLIGDDLVYLGLPTDGSVSILSSNVVAVGVARTLTDGQRFTVSTAQDTRTFEFTRDANVTAGNTAIAVSIEDSQEVIGQRVASAIAAAGLGLSPRHVGGGNVAIGGQAADTINIADAPSLTLLGQPGVRSNVRLQPIRPLAIQDGERFEISNGTTTVTFEFNNVSLNNGFNPANTPILFSSTSTSESLVASMKAAIEASALGLSTTVLPDSILELNATPRYTINTLLAPNLVQSGVPGGAQPVRFVQDASFTGGDMVKALIHAINQAANTNLSAFHRSDETLFVENAQFISTNLNSYFLKGVADQAGNLIQPNRSNNETAFTILMPGVSLDYGDAPDPFENTLGRYPTLRASDAARHVASGVTILGASTTPELDGQPTPGANGDSGDDGVVLGTNYRTPGLFNRHIQVPVTVTLSSPGFLDGWFDWNVDGDWDDAGEQVFVSELFTEDSLTRTFMVTIASSAPVPLSVVTSYARFRSSSTGGLTPRGLATDGEVEDYEIKLAPGVPPTSVDNVYVVNEDAVLVTTDPDGLATANFTADDGVAANDVSPGGLPLGAVLEPGRGPLNASEFELRSDGTFTYRPRPNFFGTDTFVYRANDGLLNANDLATVTITVTEINDSPIAVNDLIQSDEDQNLVISPSTLLVNDSAGPNESGQTLTVTSVQTTSQRGGSVSLSGGEIRYTPPADFFGTDTFTYTITDNGTTAGSADPKSATGTVTVQVREVNDPPIPGTRTDQMQENRPSASTVLQLNAQDLVNIAHPGPIEERSWQSVRFVGVSASSARGGTVSWDSATNLIRFVPATHFAGTDTFTYQIEDLSTDPLRPIVSSRSLGTVTVNIANINDAPYVQTALGTRQVLEDAAASLIDLNAVFGDHDIAVAGDALTFQVISQSNSGLAQATVVGGSLRIEPQPDKNGQTSIVVEAKDIAGLTVRDTLTLTVTPVNDAPRLVNPLPSISVNKNTVIPGIRLSPDHFFDPDVEPNGDVLTFQLVGNSNPSMVSAVIENGVLNLTLLTNQFGTGSVVVQATDRANQSVTGAVTLTISNLNEPPVGRSDEYRVPQGSLLNVSAAQGVLANDSDPENSPLTAILVSAPQQAASFNLNANGSFSYRHNGTSRQTDSFTYRASDGLLQSQLVTVTITVDARLPSTHQNRANNMDVNADGKVSAIDALLIINLLNSMPSPIRVESLGAPPPYFDVDGDYRVSAVDVLLVINELNRRSGGGGTGSGEGEGESQVADNRLLAPPVIDVLSSSDNRRYELQPVPETAQPVQSLGGPLEGASAIAAATASQNDWLHQLAGQQPVKKAQEVALAELLDEGLGCDFFNS